MNHSISADRQKNLQQELVSEELITAAIAGVVQAARSNGQSLDDLINEVLADDALLDGQQRRWLGEIVAVAWDALPNTRLTLDQAQLELEDCPTTA